MGNFTARAGAIQKAWAQWGLAGHKIFYAADRYQRDKASLTAAAQTAPAQLLM